MSEQGERDEQGHEHEQEHQPEEGSQYPTGAPSEGGGVDEDRLKWLAADEDEREAVEPHLSPAEDVAPVVPTSGPVNAKGGHLRAIVLFVLIVALGGGIWHTYALLTRADNALKVVTMSLGSEAGATPAEVKAIDGKIGEHQYEQVAADLQKLVSQAARPAPVTGANGGGLPKGAEEFLNRHPDLVKAWLALSDIGKGMKDKGYDVIELRAIKDQAMAAAAKGDEAKVRSLAAEFEGKVKVEAPEFTSKLPSLVPTGKPGGPTPEELEKFLTGDVKTAVEKAAAQHKDIRQAMQFIQEAKDTAKQGDFQKAMDLLRSALRAAEHAPRMAGGPPGGRRRMMSRRRIGPRGPMGPSAPPLQALQLLMRMVQAETPELSKAYETLENAQGAVRENNGDQITEMIQSARDTLREIAQRRHQVWTLLNSGFGGPPGRRGQRPGPGPRPGLTPQPQPGPALGQKPLPDRLAGLMEDVRKMKDTEFEQNKGQIVEAIFAMFLPPEPAPSAVKPIPAAEVERVKVKLRLASGPYFQKKNAGQDMDGIDDLFRQARTALYAGDTVTANKLVDEALVKLGLMKDTSLTAPTVGPPQ